MQITHKGEQEPQWPGRPTALNTSALALAVPCAGQLSYDLIQ